MAQQPHTYTTDAVVLRLTDCGEADRIVTLLTAARGKLRALAPGARRSKRRYGAALAPFGYGEATLRERRGGDPGDRLPVLEGLYGARGFPNLTLDLSRLSHASYACELCQSLCPESVPEPEVLALLLQLLGALDRLPAGERPRVEPLRIFELRLLQAVGLGLSLRDCAACGQEVPGGRVVAFDRVRGGVLCAVCRAGGRVDAAEALPDEVRAVLLDLLQLTPEMPPEAGLPAEVLGRCRGVLLGVIRHHLGHELRAVEFITKLNLLQI